MSNTDPTATPAAEPIKVDTRDALAVDTRDPFNMKGLEALAADPDKLANMSEKDIEAALGHITADRSTEARPAGDAPYHDMVRAAEAAASTPTPEVAPAAAVVAPAAPVVPAVAAPVVPAVATTPAAAATTDEPPFVETRDGKGRISYGVLQESRKQVQRLREENEALQARIASGAVGTPAAPTATVETPAPQAETFELNDKDLHLFTAEEVAEMKTQFPENVVNILVTNNKVAVAAMSETINLRNQLVQRDQSVRTSSTRDFIDQHPLASVWWNTETPENAALAAEAIATDELLKAHPTWGDRPDQERMEEAIRRTAIVNGIAIPSPAPTAVVPSVAQPSLQARANAAVAAAATNPTLPVSHSDLPAGGAPAQTERDVVAGLSATQLEAKLEKMSPRQIEAYLASAI